MKRPMLLVMLLLMVVAFVPNIYATTTNQHLTESDSTNTAGSVLENFNDTGNIQFNVVKESLATDNTTNNHSMPYSTNNIHQQSIQNNNSSSTGNIQNAEMAAGDETYNNVHGIWISIGDVANLDIDKMVKAGITDIFVKCNQITAPTYQSILPEIIDKFDKTPIRVHAWITCFLNQNGEWVDPSGDYSTSLISYIADITQNYDIDGIHLDYVRYPGNAYKYNGTEIITNFVKNVYLTVNSIKPKVAVSAALMPEKSVNGYYYGQDYEKLAPYLDFLVPMIYKGNYNQNTEWIGNTTAYIVNKSQGKPVIVGIQTYRSDNNLTPLSSSEIMGDIKSAMDNGASGYALFRYGWLDKQFLEDAAAGNSVSFSIAEICAGAKSLKAYIEANNKLPGSLVINNKQVDMPQFLQLMVTGLLKISNGNNSTTELKTPGTPGNPYEKVSNGNIYKSEYLELAKKIQTFIDTNNIAPNYATSSLGKIRYESLIYMYSRILNYYNNNQQLPNYATIKTWTGTTSTSNNTSNTTNTTNNGYSLAQINEAAGRVKNYIETNQQLPNYVTINNKQVTMPQFLQLMVTGLLKISNGDKTLTALTNPGTASNPLEDVTPGNIYKSEYLELAKKIQTFIDTNNIAPNYATSSLGKIRYESLIYMYSRILNYYNNNQQLPNYATIKTWTGTTSTSNNTPPTGMEEYLRATLNCQSDNPTIVALANSIISGKTTTYAQAQALFNWVRDNIDYAFYYNSQKGALQTYYSGSGNCCDHANLLVALCRAVSIPARYVHGICTFSDGTFGHVWAQIYVDGTWYDADAISAKNSFGVINNWDTSTWTLKGIYAELPF